VGRQHGITSCHGRGCKEPRRPREWKSVRLRECPRSIASGQSRLRRFAQGSSPRPHGVTLIFRCPVSSTGRLRQVTWRQARYGPAEGRKSRQAGERGSLCGAGKRRARSEVFGRTARGKIIFVGGARGESPHGREVNRRSRARGKNQTRRSRRDIAASSGGTTQNAAKTVMTDRSAARGAGPRSVLGATNAAREGKGGGRRGCGEKTLQQKRIERERADRDAPCNRPLPERPHRQSLYPLRSQSHSAKRHWSE
jgi:hypothetical protein